MNCSERAAPGRHACRRHLRYAARQAAKIRAQRSAQGLCVSCGKRPQFWGIRCVICSELCARRPLPGPALKAIRHYRRLKAQLEVIQIKERIEMASRVLLAKGFVSGKRAWALQLYIGLDKDEWRTYRQVAKIMKVSCERVRQLLAPSKAALEADLEDKIPWRQLATSGTGKKTSFVRGLSHGIHNSKREPSRRRVSENSNRHSR